MGIFKKKKDQSRLNEFSSDSVRQMQVTLKQAFENIKQEFADHLTSINQNTNEIESNYGFLTELDHKIEKLAERVDEISMYLGLGQKSKDYSIKPLTRREQEVFLVLYTLKDDSALTYAVIARRLGLTENLVQNYVSNLISKGVPVVKRYVNGHVHLGLDPQFRSLQAKENIVGVHRKVSEGILNE
jgi:DNA-binding CsgD family transcriptional regulator